MHPGRNFAAGMSGGIAYVWDRDGKFNMRCNLATVQLEKLESGSEETEVREMIARHHEYTQSRVAAEALADWPAFVAQCVKVMPTDYKRVLQEAANAEQLVAAK